MKMGKMMTIGGSAVTIIGSIAAAIIWLNFNIVWASSYQEDRQQQTEINLFILIDQTKDSIRITTDPVYKKDLQERLERYKARLLELQKVRDKK